ncbi:hypothetical protein [Actinacidiphila epipremni]|uniref:Uncharacterized protein n=1 Tax=Actinacidiphila epipremni TaxID=2053013 RepID=A0ABX0ZTD9_9ACTN|nr:hypothetical protein [Actinacidiphila epipremni]NJP46027.1 hypothetical protein [Actinacidiphila epipremni]
MPRGTRDDWLAAADTLLAAGLAVAAALTRTVWPACLAAGWAALAWRQGRLAARRRHGRAGGPHRE